LVNPGRYRFGPFCMDLEERVLLREGKPVYLSPKLFETLRVLVLKQGHIVEKDELMKQIWPDAFVEEGNLVVNIFQLRKTLGATADGGEYIETIPRRGYRFVAAVKPLGTESKDSSDTSRAINSIAVLPLENCGANPETEYVADGITESLIRLLSEIPGLKVISRHSVYHYKGRDVDAVAVGDRFGVSAVLTGRVMLLRGRLSVAAELVDATNNCHLWADRYERKAADSFTLPEDISRKLTERLRPRIAGELRAQRRPTSSNEAYHLYLKGRYQWNKRTREAIEKGIRYFEHALVADPDFSLAYAGLADCYTLLGSAGYAEGTSREAMHQAKVAAGRALEMDPQLAEAHTSLAFVTFRLNWDWSEAEKRFQRARALNSNYATAHHWYAIYLAAMDRPREAIQEIGCALELDPLSLIINAAAGRVYHFAREYNRAIEQFTKTLELDPAFTEGQYDLGMAYAESGRLEEAIATIEKALAQSPDRTLMKAVLAHIRARAGQTDSAKKTLQELKELAVTGRISPLEIALVHAGLGKKQETLRYLERAYSEHDGLLIYLKVEPMYDSLRAEPGFRDLLRRMSFPQ
jgi:TolB-like protein/Tfp pilus assembly protein PilF